MLIWLYKLIYKIIRYKHSNEKWKDTDIIMKIDDELPNQHLDLGDTYKSDKLYTCIRSYNVGICLYVPTDKIDKFKKYSDIYNPDTNMIDITSLEKYFVSQNAFSHVSNKITPPSIQIKKVQEYLIGDIIIFVSRVISLKQTDQLFKDILNYETLKEKYHLV